MRDQIDWSKAPEWATRLMRNKYGCHDAWADDHKDAIWVTDYESGSDMIFNLDPSVWGLIENRPTTPSWSGEGLPPAGVKVLIMNPEQFAITDYGQEFVGEECTVRAAFVNDLDYSMVAVEKVGGACCCFLSEMCFPIRTHEQIAAGEREAAILDMERICRIGDFGSGGLAALYDAGFRKA